MARMPATERRVALGQAALAVIARDGVHAATTRAIVAEAGMPLASFHYAVASREELLRDVVGLVVAGEGDALLASPGLDAPDLRSAVRDVLGSYLDLVKSDPGREQAMFELTQHALRSPGMSDLPAQQYAAKVIRFMHDHGVEQSALRAVSLAAYAHAQNNPAAVMHGRPLDAAKYDLSLIHI